MAPELLSAVQVSMRLNEQTVFLARAGCRAQRGVTLIEVAVTMAMTAVALSISMPAFRTLRGPHQAAVAAHQVVAAVEGARLRAIAKNVRYRVTFAAGSRYTVEREVSPNTFVAEGGTQTLPAGVGAAASATPLFDTRGMLAVPVTLTLTSTAVPTKTITINALGQATIQQ